mgnify:FL=1
MDSEVQEEMNTISENLMWRVLKFIMLLEEQVISVLEVTMELTKSNKCLKILNDIIPYGEIQTLQESRVKLDLKQRKKTTWRWILSQFIIVLLKRSFHKINFMEELSEDMKSKKLTKIKYLDGALQQNELSLILEQEMAVKQASRFIKLLEEIVLSV